MRNAVMITISSLASEDTEASFNHWYDAVHVPEVRAAVPAIVRVTRYRLVDLADRDPAAQFIAIYESDSKNIREDAAHLRRAMQDGRITPRPPAGTPGRPTTLILGEGISAGEG